MKLLTLLVCFLTVLKMRKSPNDCQINYQQRNVIWRFNSLTSWNIQEELSAFNHWCCAARFKAWLDSWDLKISLWSSALQCAPLFKISHPPTVVTACCPRPKHAGFWEVSGCRGQMVCTEDPATTKVLNSFVLVSLCAKRVGKLKNSKVCSLSRLILLRQLLPFGVTLELTCISSFKKASPLSVPFN